MLVLVPTPRVAQAYLIQPCGSKTCVHRIGAASCDSSISDQTAQTYVCIVLVLPRVAPANLIEPCGSNICVCIVAGNGDVAQAYVCIVCRSHAWPVLSALHGSGAAHVRGGGCIFAPTEIESQKDQHFARDNPSRERRVRQKQKAPSHAFHTQVQATSWSNCFRLATSSSLLCPSRAALHNTDEIAKMA